MKKVPKVRRTDGSRDELQSEYRLDYAKAKSNRFAVDAPPDCVAVTLDPDVATVFKDARAVNKVLRAVIEAMPAPSR